MHLDEPDLAHLRDVLDSSFGEGPPLPPPADRLAAGRAALRRRRRVEVVGSAAAVAVVLGASFAMLGGDPAGTRGADPVAPAPTVTTPAVEDTDETGPDARLESLAAEKRAERARAAGLVSNRFPASLDPVDGSLVVKRGWQVEQRVPEPVGFQAPEASLGVVVSNGSSTRWMLLTLERMRDASGAPLDLVAPTASADDAGVGYSRFEDWLASMVAISGGAQPEALVIVGADDQVVAGPGSTLVEVQEIDVVEGYTSPGDRVAEVRRDGRTWFVVIRGHASDAEVIPVDAAVLPRSTLAALLTYLSQQAASGEGVR